MWVLSNQLKQTWAFAFFQIAELRDSFKQLLVTMPKSHVTCYSLYILFQP